MAPSTVILLFAVVAAHAQSRVNQRAAIQSSHLVDSLANGTLKFLIFHGTDLDNTVVAAPHHALITSRYRVAVSPRSTDAFTLPFHHHAYSHRCERPGRISTVRLSAKESFLEPEWELDAADDDDLDLGEPDFFRESDISSFAPEGISTTKDPLDKWWDEAGENIYIGNKTKAPFILHQSEVHVVEVEPDSANVYYALAQGLQALGMHEDGIAIRRRIADFISTARNFCVEGKELQWWAGQWNMSVQEFSYLLAEGFRFEGGIELPIFSEIWGVDVCLYEERGQWFSRIQDFASGRQSPAGTVMLGYIGKKGNLDLYKTLVPITQNVKIPNPSSLVETHAAAMLPKRGALFALGAIVAMSVCILACSRNSFTIFGLRRDGILNSMSDACKHPVSLRVPPPR